MFPKAGAYVVNNIVVKSDKCKDDRIWTISNEEREVKAYAYDEAVDLTGHGSYSMLLLLASCFSLLGLVLDMFAIASVSSVAACDLHLGTREEHILLSIPFIGAIVTAYPWGYISDTQGRRKTWLVAMWGSFIASCLAALSPHWIMLAVLKLASVSCSGSTQSISYTLIGESCGTKVKAVYNFILTSIIHVGNPLQMGLHYYTLTLDFSFDLGLITFTPWRCLAIVLALPLGASAICLHFIYESPKFLANAGKEDEAVVILERIWKRNQQPGKMYPVKKLIFNEEGSSRSSEVSLLQSLKNQTTPLFKMPLLLRTMMLNYLNIVIYISCGGLFIWFPFLANAFISGLHSNHSSPNHTAEGLCNMISQYPAMKGNSKSSVSCIPKSDLVVVWATAVQGMVLVIINCSVGFLANKRKFLMICTLMISSLAALGCATLSSNVASLTTFYTIFLAVICTGILFSYFVDLYPTSYRGMAACLGIMVARLSNIVAINLVGSIILSHCNATFYLISAILFSGVVISCFLPSDQVKKSN